MRREENIKDDLISRKAVLELLQNEYIEISITNAGREEFTIAEINVDALKALPSVEPVKNKGEWIEHELVEETYQGYLVSNYECDNCHEWVRDQSNYCPNCGSKMEV